MGKLTLKQLTPYLSYDIKIKSHRGIVELGHENNLEEITVKGTVNTQGKPILKPLSNLLDGSYDLKIKSWFDFDVVVVKYENISDFSIKVRYVLMGETFSEMIVNRNSIYDVQYSIVINLIENHFDVFNLIEKGLAINIDTL